MIVSSRSAIPLTGLVLLVAGALAPLAASTLVPTVLAPGGTVSPLPQFNDDLLTGLVAYQYVPFGTGTAPSGMFLNFLSTSSLNPFGSEDLVFGYLVAVGAGTVTEVTVSGFSGFDAAVKVADDGAGYIAPYAATRSNDGNAITFLFAGIPSGPLPTGSPLSNFSPNPSSTSDTLDIYTNAPYYTDPLVTITDVNGSTAQFDTLGPAATAPEPSSFWLLLLPVLLVGIFARRLRAEHAGRRLARSWIW